MSGALVLTDYSPIKEQDEITFCRRLQKEINRDPSGIVKLNDWLSANPDDAEDEDQEDQETQKKKTITVFLDSFGAYSAGKYAGVLHFEGRTVLIHSRFDGSGGNNRFLNYTLSRAGVLPMSVLRNMDTASDIGTFEPLLVYLFLRQLREAYDIGVYRQYRTYTHNDARLRGQLDLARHIKYNPMSNGRVAYTTREYTVDNPINHLILAAWRCLQEQEGTKELLEKFFTQDPSLEEPLKQLTWSLGPAPQALSARRELLRQVMRPITHPMYQRYEKVRRTAILILQEKGVTLFADREQTATGILIPMDRLWEIFLEKSVFSRLENCRVKTQEHISIIKKGEVGKRVLKPDFLMQYGHSERRRVTARVVLDAKYRAPWGKTWQAKTWSNNVRYDVFQVLAYMLVTGAYVGGVVFPLKESEESEDAPAFVEYELCAGMGERFAVIPFCIPDGEKFEDNAAYEAEMDNRCEFYAGQVRSLLEEKLPGTDTTENYRPSGAK